MPIDETTKAKANPKKSFFVYMITRDISLEDCILDLIDNSVDGAWRSEGSRPIGLAEAADLSKYSIKVTAKPDIFCIEDNSGGMSLNDAVNHAFSFGRADDAEQNDYSIGVYGIGMKRAVFKLGTDIRIRSKFTDQLGQASEFAVPISVTEWINNDTFPWDFDIVVDSGMPANGVEITVRSLTPRTATSFGNPAFIQNLRRMIARDYSLHLSRGINISLNGEPISPIEFELRQSADFVPLRMTYEEDFDGQKVSVEIIGGMAAPPPETADPADEDDSDRRYGWYVACNGRIVLAADKTALSGWGTEWPQWHGQYAGFIGIVLFSAADAALLPLTTTKRSVDTSSEVYSRARPKMREVTRAWISYTNVRKQVIEEAKVIEQRAEPVLIQSVLPSTEVRLPVLIPRLSSEPVANITYSVSKEKLKKLAREMGQASMSNREVGIKSFDYTYDDLVGDE